MVIISGGGQIFNPGPLTAVHPQNRSLQGFVSHAGFEKECSRCHRPLLGPTADRCLACHTTVAGQINTTTALHGVLRGVDDCVDCHPDHLGPEARITRVDTADFPHQEATGFSLAQHLRDYDSSAIECVDCHSGDGYSLELIVCATCHASAEPIFMIEHQATFGSDCLACHDGNRNIDVVDHASFFPLEGMHATTGCLSCHVRRQFKGAPRDCYSCHRVDDIHQGQLGTECNACHTPTTWQQIIFDHTVFFPLEGRHATTGCIDCHIDQQFKGTQRDCYSCHMADDMHQGELGTECSACHSPAAWKEVTINLETHIFPLTHKNGGRLIDCQVCHISNIFRTYTCYGCHEHNPAKIEREHLEEGIRDFQNCAGCHPTGDEDEGDDDRHEYYEEDDDSNDGDN